MKFSGSDYVKTRDNERLANDLSAIVEYMKDGQWRTVEQIAWQIRNSNHSSISAQIRNIRKLGYKVERRWKDGIVGISEYRMTGDKLILKEEDGGQISFI